MKTINADDIKNLAELLDKSKSKKKGYILLPSNTGFDFYEISEDRLKQYLEAEQVHRVLTDKDLEYKNRPHWLQKHEYDKSIELYKERRIIGVKYLRDIAKIHVQDPLSWSVNFLKDYI